MLFCDKTSFKYFYVYSVHLNVAQDIKISIYVDQILFCSEASVINIPFLVLTDVFEDYESSTKSGFDCSNRYHHIFFANHRVAVKTLIKFAKVLNEWETYTFHQFLKNFENFVLLTFSIHNPIYDLEC